MLFKIKMYLFFVKRLKYFWYGEQDFLGFSYVNTQNFQIPLNIQSIGLYPQEVCFEGSGKGHLDRCHSCVQVFANTEEP